MLKLNGWFGRFFNDRRTTEKYVIVERRSPYKPTCQHADERIHNAIDEIERTVRMNPEDMQK